MTSKMKLSGSRLKCSSSKSDKNKNHRFYGKVKETDSLGVRKSIIKKKKYIRRQKTVDVFDLPALFDFLPKLKVADQPSMFFLQVTWRRKKKLIHKKGIQVGSLLNRPAYEPHPLASIHQSLQSSQCMSKRGQVTNFRKQIRKNRSIRKSIASAGLYQAMEC